MKNLLMFVAIVGIIVASGSVAYYYLVILPKQAAEVSAIRRAVAPTTEETQADVDAVMKEMEAFFGQPSMYKKPF